MDPVINENLEDDDDDVDHSLTGKDAFSTYDSQDNAITNHHHHLNHYLNHHRNDGTSYPKLQQRQRQKQRPKQQVRRPEIAVKESKAVNQLRIIVFFVLFVAAMIVSILVYMITSRSQQNEFKVQYDGMSQQLIDAFYDIMIHKVNVIGSLRVSLMAHAIDNNVQWPYVTLSSFQQRAEAVRQLSNILYVGLCPIIEESQRNTWETYVAKEAPKWM
jgi:hypothetical protein